MKLLLKQKLLSFLDSFNVFYEDDSIAYTVKSRIALGKICLSMMLTVIMSLSSNKKY